MSPAASIVLDDALIASWTIAMHAERRAARTVKIYTNQVAAYRRWTGEPSRFDRRRVLAFLAHEGERLAGNSLVVRYNGLRQLAVWLHAEGETPEMLMAGVKKPQVSEAPVPLLTDEQVKTMLRACEGTDYADRRDMAVVRLLLDTGARASEVTGLFVSDVDLRACTVRLNGKGGRVRMVPFGAVTARALDRYLRARRGHRYAASESLWLGQRGPWTYDGMSEALRQRARGAGVDVFHPHLLRHLLAHRWLAAGGSELGLQDVAGWRSGEMVRRYAASARGERATAEHRRLALGDSF